MQYLSLCRDCKHLHQPGKDESVDTWKCSAFPSGIPEDILLGMKQHLRPVKGQVGRDTIIIKADSKALMQEILGDTVGPEHYEQVEGIDV